MRILETAAMLAAISLVPACGHQLVEFALADANGTGADASGTGVDARRTDAGSNSVSPPTVIATGPSNLATNVALGEHLDATFSRAMLPATIDNATFTVRQGASVIAGTVTYAGTMATFVPSSPLDLSLQYTGTITTGATDPTGDPIAVDYVWTFTTGACSLQTIALQSASNVAVLAGSTVTSTGATMITGDVGVSPGTSITGFPPGIVVGAQHADDSTSAQALADLTTAYDDAASRSLCALTVAGNLGGHTLTPGLYTSTSSLAISSGDLTLDALGDPDAVFIFQMASTLTTTSGRQVILSGGANAANVYWQVGASAVLGTNSVFQGTIMANQSITLDTGASLNGRALAEIGGVSLDTNAITMP